MPRKWHDYRVATYSAVLSVVLASAFTISRSNSLAQDVQIGSKDEPYTTQFAERVVSFEPGSPSPVVSEANPANLLGPPDYETRSDGKVLTLGCNGAVVVDFGEYNLFNLPGDDLKVFEVGDVVEAFSIALSRDKSTWHRLPGSYDSTKNIDFGNLNPKDGYRYLKLTDADPECRSGNWPGADIDAVLALHAKIR